VSRAAGLVLAAGAGRRFGAEPKLLARVAGRPVLQHVVDHARAILHPVVVVLGAHAEAIATHVHLGDARAVICDDWAEGQAASLRRGAQALAEEQKVLVLLGDQPFVTPDVIERLAAEPPGTRAAYGGEPGHPAVLGPELLALAATLHGDAGLRDADWRLVECGDRSRAADLDTPDDLEAIRDEARARL
jgi:molybdenum cofactor cytidylyltransferase